MTNRDDAVAILAWLGLAWLGFGFGSGSGFGFGELPAALGASPGGEARWRRLALGERASRCGWRVLFRSCVRGRLRPAAFARLRCGARRPGLRRKVVGVADSCQRPIAQRRLVLLDLASLGNPGRLRSSPLPKSRNRNPHPPRSAMFLAWQMRRQKSALAKASESEGHRVQAGPLRGAGRRANGPNGSSRGGLACLTFSFALASALQSFFSQARRRRRVGRRGLPSRDFGSGEERRRPGLPRAAGPRRASRRCAVGREHGPATPATSCRSPGRRAPQRSRAKAAGRSRPRTHERAGNPRHPAPRDLQAPPAAPALRPRRSAQRRRQVHAHLHLHLHACANAQEQARDAQPREPAKCKGSHPATRASTSG